MLNSISRETKSSSLKVLIWGGGTDGHRLFDRLQYVSQIVGFIDSDKKLEGHKICGVPVKSPDFVSKEKFDYVIIANSYYKEIKIKLTQQYSIPEAKIFHFEDSEISKLFFNSQMDRRLETLAALSREIYYNNIDGAVAELGVFKGDFARYINQAFPERKLYLFDTFAGFDERDISLEQEHGFSYFSKNDYFNGNIEMVLEKMRNRSKCVVKAGYFPESLGKLEDVFCFVSLDADLYAPIKSGLEYFYPRLSRGGYILVHDFNNLRFPGVKQAVREFCMKYKAAYLPLEYCGSSIVCK